MKTILVLGNGFDLHYKLPTTYLNFLHTAIFIRDNYRTGRFRFASNVFGDSKLNQNDDGILHSWNEYHVVYNHVQLPQDKVEEICNLARGNLWFRFFETHHNEDLGWIDFEIEIQNVLNVFAKFFDIVDAIENKTPAEQAYIYYDGGVIYNTLDAFNMVDGNISMHLEYDSITGKKDTRDISLLKAEYYYNPLCIPGVMLVDKSKLMDVLNQSLCEFTKMLSLYLSCFVNSAIAEAVQQSSVIPLKAFDNADNVIVFNYTDTFELLYPTISKDNICHIHGCLKEQIVLGVNSDKTDEDEYGETLFLPFKKYYQRAIYNTDVKYLNLLREIKANSVNPSGEEINILVFGHSLDTTDREAIRELFLHATSIEVVYHDERALANLVKNLVDIFKKPVFDSLRSEHSLHFTPASSIS